MSDITFDELDSGSLPFSGLTNVNFESQEFPELNNSNFEGIFENESLDLSNRSLSPCMISSTAINPISLATSPRGLDDDRNEDFVKTKQPSKSTLPRQIYLITYSQADVLKVQGRETFAEFVTNEFNRQDHVVDKWVVSAELHRKSGIHYHLAIKLKKQRRFAQVRINLKRKYDIDVDFHEWHDNYFSAYTYVTKFDKHYMTSENHPVLDNDPVTSKATSVKRALANQDDNKQVVTKKSKPYKHPRLTNEQLGTIIRENNIRSPKQLYAFAKIQAKEGKIDLQNFLYKRPNAKQHADLISTVWSIEESEADLLREQKSRMEILEEAKLQPCDSDSSTGKPCNGSWLQAALETLSHNKISRNEFSSIIVKNLKEGRGKGCNVMICGPTNCAKSFILLPLTKIYKCFMTPSQGTYNWVDAPEKEVIFLNDIRYDSDGEKRVMPWHMFLNLLEGVTVNISMPKNFFSKDFEWSERQPIFATSDKPIIRIRNGSIDEGETEQMAQRWRIIKFQHQYLGKNVNYSLVPCRSCFAKLILDE